MRTRMLLKEPRGPWKAKGDQAPRQVAVYVCLFCRVQFGATRLDRKSTQARRLSKSGAYACPPCIEEMGGLAAADEEALLRVMRAHGTPRGVVQNAQP